MNTCHCVVGGRVSGQRRNPRLFGSLGIAESILSLVEGLDHLTSS